MYMLAVFLSFRIPQNFTVSGIKFGCFIPILTVPQYHRAGGQCANVETEGLRACRVI